MNLINYVADKRLFDCTVPNRIGYLLVCGIANGFVKLVPGRLKTFYQINKGQQDLNCFLHDLQK